MRWPTCSVRTRQSAEASLRREFSAFSLWVVHVTVLRLRMASTWMKSLGRGGASGPPCLAVVPGLGALRQKPLFAAYCSCRHQQDGVIGQVSIKALQCWKVCMASAGCQCSLQKAGFRECRCRVYI